MQYIDTTHVQMQVSDCMLDSPIAAFVLSCRSQKSGVELFSPPELVVTQCQHFAICCLLDYESCRMLLTSDFLRLSKYPVSCPVVCTEPVCRLGELSCVACLEDREKYREASEAYDAWARNSYAGQRGHMTTEKQKVSTVWNGQESNSISIRQH